MTDIGIISLVLIAVNFLFSYQGFKDPSFFDANKFEVDSILIGKDYKRLVTSGFLHVGWTHLIFNMISLYAFSTLIEEDLGRVNFLIIYFASLIGGDLLALFVHRNHGDYSAVGASGAVSGVIFASIVLYPDIEIGMVVLPVFIKGWIYGILYVLYSIYGIKSNKDNIGHEAHLGGALIGILAVLILRPTAWQDNYLTILLITVPMVVFIWLIITRPQVLLIDNFYFKTHNDHYDLEHDFNAGRTDKQKDLDFLLDKINKKGMRSLSKKERERLDEYSK